MNLMKKYVGIIRYISRGKKEVHGLWNRTAAIAKAFEVASNR